MIWLWLLANRSKYTNTILEIGEARVIIIFQKTIFVGVFGNY